MPIYITLWKYTKDGLVDIHNTRARFESVRKIVEANGGKLLEIYALVGEYDIMTIMEMPNKNALTTTILRICSSGRITANTLTAMRIEEFLKITDGI